MITRDISLESNLKDRIDMMKKKEEESTAQFDNVMRDIQDVRSSPRQFSGNIGVGGGSGMVIPRHLSPGHPAHHPQFRYIYHIIIAKGLFTGGEHALALIFFLLLFNGQIKR